MVIIASPLYACTSMLRLKNLKIYIYCFLYFDIVFSKKITNQGKKTCNHLLKYFAFSYFYMTLQFSSIFKCLYCFAVGLRLFEVIMSRW